MRRILLRIAQSFFPDREFVSILKWELKLLLIHAYAKLSPLERLKVCYLRGEKNLKVNLGSGTLTHSGWVNIDCRISWKKRDLVCDLRRPWPISSGCVKYIFTDHVFEHICYPEGAEHFLRKCNRILQPGGVLRIIIPDAGLYLRAYTMNNENFLSHVGDGAAPKISSINKVFRENGFHKYAYDYEMLKKLLGQAGFKDVRRSCFRGSQCEDLNLDLDEPKRKLVSMYVEAVRP